MFATLFPVMAQINFPLHFIVLSFSCCQIIETMSYSENVANFMHVLGPFYEAVYDGQEPENLRRNPSPQLSEGMDKDQQEDESGYSSSINGTGAEETGTNNLNKYLRRSH